MNLKQRPDKLFFMNACKLLNAREFSSISDQIDKLDPNWVTGFVDAEGCFSVMVEISKDFKSKSILWN